MKSQCIENWKLYYVSHEALPKTLPITAEQLSQSGLACMQARVPGSFLQDLSASGKLPEDLYFGDNVLKTQQYEDHHLWYVSSFTLTQPEYAYLHFGGIDTAAEIYLDGVLLGKTENMFIPHEFSLAQVAEGEHEVVVHILPVSEYLRDKEVPSYCRSLDYHRDTLQIRKAPYMFGWDIMPRAVDGGLWQKVELIHKDPYRIEECYGHVRKIKGERVDLQFDVRISVPTMRPGLYLLRLQGVCGESRFETDCTVFGFQTRMRVSVENPHFWWPKGYGDPDQYDISVQLLKEGQVCGEYDFKMGIRTARLERRDRTNGDGEFRFLINNKPIYVLGTNWVPTDAFPSRHNQRLFKSLPLLKESHCNMIRLWGGNVYPDDELYNWCDENGIMVWQDFAMACGIYPQDERLQGLLRQEAEWVVRARRQHASLVIWCGDNECDEAYIHEYRAQTGQPDAFDPNLNVLTRKVLPEVIYTLDGRRPYLPSSPYVSSPSVPEMEYAERHLWGPRGDFKGEFYAGAECHFVSEMGYHGCPAPQSLRGFIAEDRLERFGDSTACNDAHWLTHSACVEIDRNGQDPYSYRIPLMVKQVERLFGTAASDIDSFARQSQISQAEADKFFVEHFRMRRDRCGGLIWWNLIDGWPQISDAVADWYGRAKLAYHYIRFSQRPICMMMEEPEDDCCQLFAVNETRESVHLRYTVEDLWGEVVAKGEVTLAADEGKFIDKVKVEKGHYYLIRWQGDDEGQNHYITLNDGITLPQYLSFMEKVKYDTLWEGFDK